MKAQINASGILIIQTETELESYALRAWVGENWKGCSRAITTENIELDWGLKKETTNDQINKINNELNHCGVDSVMINEQMNKDTHKYLVENKMEFSVYPPYFIVRKK